MTRLKIYLVEDCHVTRDHIADELEANANAHVLAWASTETAARDWLAKNTTGWDLAVVDLFLAEGNGLNILKTLPKRPHQRVVVLSNYLTSTIKQRCLSFGADAVFDKSSELEEFLRFAMEMRQTSHAA